jgi:hypothetical protein
MMSLRALQEAFQDRILGGRAAIEAQLAASDAADFPDRLRVYTQGYGSRLVEALGITYPALKSVLGEAEFERAMQSYITSVPSHVYSVRRYGERVAEFVAHGRAEPSARVLSDLARWEWTLAEVFDAPDDAPAGAAQIAGLSAEAWADVSFVLRSSLRRTATMSNAVDWWRSLEDPDSTPEALESHEPVDWLLWRRGLNTYFRSMAPLEGCLIDAALGGAPFARLCELVAAEVEESAAPARAASLLRGWFAEELIARVVLPQHAP